MEVLGLWCARFACSDRNRRVRVRAASAVGPLKEEPVELKSIEQILDYAISNEEKAAALYYELADKVDRPGMREAL